ncbi:hypothetical protein K438DRAFT_183850 [Mycena galopus ATCC 62051]|nr:hypothetical protein K438DRAFT_183850 [Mycena galopus ATCC 62051]
MITDVNLTQASSRTMISRPLKRGRACMNCRFLKIKCDGIKPICGPCRKHPKDDECEYSDGPARSRTKALEDTVQRLEARLHELEHPEDSTPPVTLYDPPVLPQLTISPSYPSSSRSLPNTPYHQQPRVPSGSSPESQGYTPLSPFSPPSTTATTPPFGTHGHGSSVLGIFDARVMATPESTPWNLESDPTLWEAHLQTFRPHASRFGFFLDWNRCLRSILHSVPPHGTIHESSALLNALCMWGAHLSSDRQREMYFKHKALQSVTVDLTPQSFLHTLQAEVLLSHFFFRTGHFLEARAHTATAGALALAAGLHQIRSLNHPDMPVLETTEKNDRDIYLRAPADAIEEGEQINGFWAVFMLQNNLSVALGPPARACGVLEADDMQIDRAWALKIEDYKQKLLTTDIHGDSTVDINSDSVNECRHDFRRGSSHECVCLDQQAFTQIRWLRPSARVEDLARPSLRSESRTDNHKSTKSENILPRRENNAGSAEEISAEDGFFLNTCERDLKGRVTQDDQYPFASGGNANIYRGTLTQSDGREIWVCLFHLNCEFSLATRSCRLLSK